MITIIFPSKIPFVSPPLFEAKTLRLGSLHLVPAPHVRQFPADFGFQRPDSHWPTAESHSVTVDPSTTRSHVGRVFSGWKGGFYPSEKYENLLGWWIIPNWMKKTCSKPPVFDVIWIKKLVWFPSNRVRSGDFLSKSLTKSKRRPQAFQKNQNLNL